MLHSDGPYIVSNFGCCQGEGASLVLASVHVFLNALICQVCLSLHFDITLYMSVI